MKHKSRVYTVERIIKDYDKPKGSPSRLTFDFEIQREAGQWSKVAQSLLIHSILQGIIIPEIFIVQNGVDAFQPKTVLDGKQRLTTVYDYVKGKFSLSRNTPDVKVKRAKTNDDGDFVYDENGNHIIIDEYVKIGCKSFKQLPQEFKDNILEFEFSTRLITEATEEELEMEMYRLNNGKSQTAAQKAIMMLGMDLGSAIKEATLNSFIYDRLVFTPAQRKNAEDKKIILNCLTVLNDYNYKKLSTASDMSKIAENMKQQGWTQSQIDYCKELFEKLNALLPSNDDIGFDKKFFSTTNIPILIANMY